jgi:hypothetical protein
MMGIARNRACFTLAALLNIVGMSEARAGVTETCLTGTAADVAGDTDQIRMLRASIDATCACSSFDGGKGKTHGDYVNCARSLIDAAQQSSHLRKQCKSAVKKVYVSSTCGMNVVLHAAPCVSTSLVTQKVTCSVKPTTKNDGVTSTNACADRPGKSTVVICSGYTHCVDALVDGGSFCGNGIVGFDLGTLPGGDWSVAEGVSLTVKQVRPISS